MECGRGKPAANKASPPRRRARCRAHPMQPMAGSAAEPRLTCQKIGNEFGLCVKQERASHASPYVASSARRRAHTLRARVRCLVADSTTFSSTGRPLRRRTASISRLARLAEPTPAGRGGERCGCCNLARVQARRTPDLCSWCAPHTTSLSQQQVVQERQQRQRGEKQQPQPQPQQLLARSKQQQQQQILALALRRPHPGPPPQTPPAPPR